MPILYTFPELDYLNVTETGIEVNPHKKWTNRGFYQAEGLVSPDRTLFYLAMPKNASSSIKDQLFNLGWEVGDFYEFPDTKVIVTIRDPIERWISGIAEYLILYHSDIIEQIVDPDIYQCLPLLHEKLAISLIFNTITFDDHTDRQCFFLSGLDFSRCIWLNFKTLNITFPKLLKEFNQTDSLITLDNMNNSDENIRKKDLKNLFKLILKTNNHAENKLKEYFWCDYKLINRVKFYD